MRVVKFKKYRVVPYALHSFALCRHGLSILHLAYVLHRLFDVIPYRAGYVLVVARVLVVLWVYYLSYYFRNDFLIISVLLVLFNRIIFFLEAFLPYI